MFAPQWNWQGSPHQGGESRCLSRNFHGGIPDSWECSPEELECEFDQHFHGSWDNVTPGRLKFPDVDGCGRAFGQTLAQQV